MKSERIASLGQMFQIKHVVGTRSGGAMTEEFDTVVKSDGPKGLGGWLILVGLGVVISPLRIVFEGVTAFGPLLRDNILRDVADPHSSSYVAYLAEFIYIEMLFNVIFAVWAVLNLVWFFSQSTKFPASFRYFLLANLAFLVGDTFVSTNFMPSNEAFDPATVKAIVQSAIAAAIWVPYTIVSKRVKNTFVN
jgi:hypothetical protein